MGFLARVPVVGKLYFKSLSPTRSSPADVGDKTPALLSGAARSIETELASAGG